MLPNFSSGHFCGEVKIDIGFTDVLISYIFSGSQPTLLLFSWTALTEIKSVSTSWTRRERTTFRPESRRPTLFLSYWIWHSPTTCDILVRVAVRTYSWAVTCSAITTQIRVSVVDGVHTCSNRHLAIYQSVMIELSDVSCQQLTTNLSGYFGTCPPAFGTLKWP